MKCIIFLGKTGISEKSSRCALKRDAARTMHSNSEQGPHALVFPDNNIPEIVREPLNKEQLKLLVQVLISKVNEFPKLSINAISINDS